ncbi:TonB-dependent receptor [Methylocystis sp. MJC1]|uniref:TonB-dependent siderophore receptor n=1 Tax=Methylocystis sp. MJC1 TaxID=2654282 RepID=UPI0013E9F33A|nr:TonB-dependent receptor [Methylocystis sp. MJC1]KAF2990520.1 Ferrichrome-iron receptor [Methylocystis sp. MJC1]MBU6525817.1 TonB-dependent receptor [Methylocystis sp. MJC1]UZX12284.1 TonB-dependent receptor [Methylocystis sp. MJC1]
MLDRDLFKHVSAGVLALCYSGDALAQENLPTIEIGAPARPAVGRAAAPAAQAAPNSAPVRGQAESGPPVRQTTAGPVRGYQALTSRATRFETPIKELPMSIEVIPRKLIDDQQAISQSEVFRNVSGLQPVSPLFPGGIGPSLRGMRAERYIDGLPNFYDLGVRDLLANVERIEVLKGPASILFQGGSSPVGGVVNVISKLPTPDRFAEAGIRTGGYSYLSPYVDINQPLTENKSVLFRLTAQYETTESNVDVVRRRSYTVNPTIKFAPTDATSLTVQGYITRRDQPDYPGLPATGTIDTAFYSVRPQAFLSNAGLPASSTSSSGVTVRFDHKFDETFSTFTSARFSSSSLYEPSQIPFGNTPTFNADSTLRRLIGGPSQFYMANTIMAQQTKEISVTSNVMAKFDAGPTRNKLLLGGDFNRVWDQGYMAAANATQPDPKIKSVLDFFGFGVYAPFYPILVDFRAPVIPPYAYPLPGQGGYTTLSRINNAYQNAGVTAQLQSTIFERLHILAAGRVAFVDIYSEEGAARPPTRFNSSQTAFLPRVGALFDVTNWLSVYGSYAQGLRPVTLFNGAGGAAPKPEGSEQWEAGVKLDGPMGLSGTLAYFDLKRTNVPITPPGSLTQRQSGEWHSSGVEVDLVWQPTASLSFLASYAHIDAKVSKDLNPKIQNAPLNLAPPDSGRLWGNYAFDGFLQGWSLGAGLYAASGQVIEIGRPWSTSGYVTFDAALTFKHDNFTFSVNGKNLADHQYFVQYPYLSGRVMPAEGRALFANLSVRL